MAGVGALGVGFGRATADLLEHNRELVTLSDTYAVSLGELQTLQYGLRSFGVDQEKARDVVKDFSERLGEAALGEGEAAEALERLNLSAKELIRLPLDERLRVVTERIGQVENPSIRTALAIQIPWRSVV